MNWIRPSFAGKAQLLSEAKRTLIEHSRVRWVPQRRPERPAWQRQVVWEAQVSRV